MPTPAPHARQVSVREVSTGRVFSAWPVDARELVAHPEYEYAPVGAAVPGARPAAPVDPAPSPRSVADRLGERSYKDLQTLAKRVGVNANQKQPDLVAALVPHVEGGTVSLEELPPLALPATQFPGAEA